MEPGLVVPEAWFRSLDGGQVWSTSQRSRSAPERQHFGMTAILPFSQLPMLTKILHSSRYIL